jgi:hypothetical protein
MRLVHYSDREVRLPLDPITQAVAPSLKPIGFWLSDDDAEVTWRRWCEEADIFLERLTHVHDVTLAADCRALQLGTPSAIDQFTEAYSVDLLPGIRRGIYVDWARVARDYDALICSPYVWERRLGPMWYYGWDCASACVFNPAAVGSIVLRSAFAGDATWGNHAGRKALS